MDEKRTQEQKREVEIIAQKKEKVKSFLENKENVLLLLVITFAVVIRLYYFIKLGSQPMWWDEADYMSVAQAWAFGYDLIFAPVRQILMSIIFALFLKISNTEFLPRVFILLVSIASVPAVYYLGKKIYDKRTGIIAGLLMSFFWVNLFFSYRLLVDVPSLLFFTISSYFFFDYFKTKKPRALYLTALMIGIGTLFRLTTAVFLVPAFLFLFIVEHFSFLKKKETWVALLIYLGILAPYILWGYYKFHGFVLTMASAAVKPENFWGGGYAVLMGYLKLFNSYLTWPFLICFILGIASLYGVFLGIDRLHKKENFGLQRELYLLLLFIIPLVFLSFMIDHNEDRYILCVFPAVFIIGSAFIMKIYDSIKKNSRYLAIGFVVVIILLAGYYELKQTSALIENKKASYLEVKQAGEWLKMNSPQGAVVITKSLPQINYYSEREVYNLDSNETIFEEDMQKLNPDYLVVSIYEQHPEWITQYLTDNQDRFGVAQAYYMNEKPALIIYKVKK